MQLPSHKRPSTSRLQHLPTPAAEAVCAAFTKSAPHCLDVDLWNDDVNAPSPERIDTTRLYKPVFDVRPEPFTAADGFEMLAPLSFHVRNIISAKFALAVKRNGDAGGLAYLRKTIEQLTVVWHKYPFYQVSRMKFIKRSEPLEPCETDSEDGFDPECRSLVSASPFSAFRLLRHRKSTELTRIAASIADNCMQVAKDVSAAASSDTSYIDTYDAVAAVCSAWGITPPYWNAAHCDRIEAAIECGILRMTCAKWWGKKLLKLRDQCCEHLCVAVGLVTKKKPFVSDECFGEWKTQQKTAQQWLESTMIENEDGVILPLIEAAMAGNANPSNRVTELIVRNRGLEDMADDAGMIALAVTLTCPSKYHSNSYKWNADNAKVAQKYLVNTFAKMRSALSYRDIQFLGFRVAEPHKDSTPHWHMAWVIKPEDEAEVRRIITHYAYEVDGKEPGAAEHRLKIEAITKDRGGIAGYFIKYLLKGIPGDHMHGQSELEFESGQTIGAVSARVAAWASRYGIRQYQFYGTESVQVWRELRRLKAGPQSPEIEAARAAACGSDWKMYEDAMTHAQLSLNYELTPEGNQYGEVTRRVQGLDGIAFGEKRLIVTRGERWKLRKATDDEQEAYNTLKLRRKALFAAERAKNAESRLSRKELKDAMPKWSRSLLPSSFGSPWTCRNNCTDPVLAGVDTKIIRHLELVGITDHSDIERLLFGGRKVMDAEGMEWKVERGQLRQLGKEPSRYIDVEGVSLDELVAEMRLWPKGVKGQDSWNENEKSCARL